MELLFLNVGYSISLLDSKPITLGIKNEAVTCPVSCVLWITIEFLPTAHLTFSALVTLTSSWFISHVKVTFVFEILLRILCPNVSHPERRSVFSFIFFQVCVTVILWGAFLQFFQVCVTVILWGAFLTSHISVFPTFCILFVPLYFSS